MFASHLDMFFLVQILGLYMVIQSIILFSRADYYRALVLSMKKPDYAIWVGSSLTLILGIVLVLGHNVWVLEPRVNVTILAWLVLLKSVLWLSVPERMLVASKKLCASKGYYVITTMIFIWGAALMSRGFYMYVSEAITH